MPSRDNEYRVQVAGMIQIEGQKTGELLVVLQEDLKYIHAIVRYNSLTGSLKSVLLLVVR